MASKPIDGTIRLLDPAVKQHLSSPPVSVIMWLCTSRGTSHLTRLLDSPHRTRAQQSVAVPRTAKRPSRYGAFSAPEGGPRSRAPDSSSS
jgi:hypothetical protein